VKVVIKAYHHSRHRRTIPLPKELHYLKEFYAKDDKSPFSSFHHYYHFGTDFETIGAEVAKERPDLVGISSLFAPYYREALACAAAIKKRINVPVILGGSHVSALPEFTLSHPEVDFVIRGEGEKPWVEFLKIYSPLCKRGARGDFKSPSIPLYQRGKTEKGPDPFSKIPNLGYKKDGKLILNPCRPNYPVDALPFPDLSDLPKENYLFEKKPLCFIVTSRGCPYRCAFCSVHKTFGHRYRRRSTNNILAEMKQRYKEGYRVFDLEDDNFAFDKNETKALCEKIALSFPEKDVQLLAMNGICYWTLDPEILAAMRRAGFTHLNLSLVSTDAALLKSVRRPNLLKKYREVVSSASKLGFKIVSYQILGLPGDSLAAMLKTMIFHARLPVLLGASPFYLIPHSPIAKNFDSPSEEDIFTARLTAMAIETKKFTRRDLYTLFITTRIVNFLKGIRILQEGQSLSSGTVRLRKALEIAKTQDPRSAAGAEVLERLLREKRFYAATPKGLEPLPMFRPELFFQLWNKLGNIKNLENKTISL
jgi:radical SAM superfamily enzyme YgiQ (UPF0313 family)